MMPVEEESAVTDETASEETNSPLLSPAQPAPPSGRIAPGGLFALLLVGVLTATVIGVLWFLVTQLIDVLFVISVAAGMVLGIGISWGVRIGRVRNHTVVLVVALLLGFLSYGVKMACEAYSLRDPLKDAIVQQLITAHKIPEAEARQRAEMFLTPTQTLAFYFDIAPKEGMTFFASRYSMTTNRGLTLRGGLFWFLVLLEAGLVGITAVIRSEPTLAEPYCEKCDRWTKTSRLFRRHPALTDKVIDRVRHQDWNGLQALDQAYVGNNDFYVDVRLQQCPSCGDSTLIVKNSAHGSARFMAILPAETASALKTTLKP